MMWTVLSPSMAPVRRQAPTPMPFLRTGWITRYREGTVAVPGR